MTMDLFGFNRRDILEKEAPLASRMRPRTLDEVVGQEHIIGPGKLLSRAIQADRVGSLILYGPPGTGKTTIAQVIANSTGARFVQINATTAGKKDMEDAVSKAKATLGAEERRTILFVDEIHRFNKAQQDYLLPFVEDGTAQHSVSLAVDEDDALFAFVFVLLHHFAELIKLVVQHFPVAHAPCVVQQGVDVQVHFDDVLLASVFRLGLRLGGCVYRFLLHQGGLQVFGRYIDLLGGTVVLHDVVHQGGCLEEIRLLESMELVELHRVDA